MANIDPNPHQSEQSFFDEPPRNGACLFSTHNGRLAARYAPSQSMPIIVRDDPFDDCMQMVANLQKDFPDICAMVKKPPGYDTFYEWFDHRDACIHGAAFLLSVLAQIALQNQTRLYDYVKGWRAANAEAFLGIVPGHTVEHLFTTEDREEHGHDFLMDAAVEIKRMQALEKEQERNRIPQQNAQMITNQRDLVVSQAPATAPGVPLNAPRATSNPERHPFQFDPDHIRQIPPPNVQYTGPTGQLPLPRFTRATELLEHIVPGATSRGDFHSDPLATLGRPYPDTIMAIPGRGIPGPYGYATSRPVPLDDRPRHFSGNVPRGKKNPVKRSSDDARTQYDAEIGHRSLQNREDPCQNPDLSQNNTQKHLARSVNMSQINNVSYPGHHWHGNEHRALRYPPHIEPMGTHNFAPGPHPQSVTSGDAREGIGILPAGNSERTRGEINNPQYTHWAPNYGSGGQRSVLANMSNTRQSQLQHPPVARQRVGQGEFLEGGDRIWIGGIPHDFTKDMLMELLEPCRGLRFITDPKSPQSGKPAYIFATFENPDCAVEALERIPQTLFDMLPKGQKLSTNWPKIAAFTRGEYKGRRSLDHSPAKSRKDGEYESHKRHVSLPNSENRVTTSEGSPAISRKTADVEDRQSRDMVVGPNHRHRKSHNPENGDAMTVSKKTNDVLPTTSGAKPGTDKIAKEIKPTTLPTRIVIETDKTPQHKNAGAHTDLSSNVVTLHPAGDDGSGLGTPEMKDETVPSQALCPSSVDGIQETVTPPRTKHPNKKKNKSKSSKKTAAVDSGIVPISQGLPEVEKTNLPATVEADSPTNSRSKTTDESSQVEKHDLQNDSDRNAPMVSAPTELPDPCVKSPKGNSTVSDPASARHGTGLSPLDRPKIDPNLSRSGPNDNLHGDSTDEEQIPNVGSHPLAPVAPSVPTGLDQEPESQAMTRDTSMSTEYSVPFHPTSTAPSSFLATERSNSVAEDSQLKSVSAHAASLERKKQTTAGIDPEQLRSKLEAQADATTSETGDTTKAYVVGPQHAIDENVKKGKSKDDVSKKASKSATPPRSQSSARTPTSSRSPDRKQAPDIPQRSSSLSVSSTPIHTRLRKKPKTFSPVSEEAPGGANTPIDPADGPAGTQKSELSTRQSNSSTPANPSPSAHRGNSRSNKKKRANNPKSSSSTVHAPTSPTPSSKRKPLPKPEMPFRKGDEDSVAVSTPVITQQVLPKPERPFCTDDGTSLLVPALGETGQYNVTLEYDSVEDLFAHFASDMPSPGSPMTPSLTSKTTIELSSPDTQSYISRLKGRIDEVLAHKTRGSTLVKEDGSVPLECQERVWGEVLSMHEYPDETNSRTDPEKWAFWAADFLRPNSTQPSPLIRELGMNIKYFAGTSIRYYNLLRYSSDTSALVQEYKEGIALVDRMPGCPWAPLKSRDWERLAIDFIRRLMTKYNVSFPNSTEAFEEDTSTAIKPYPRGIVEQGPSASSQPSGTSVTTILDPLKQRQAKLTEEIAHAKKCGLDISALEFVREESQYVIDNSPLELTTQIEPKEWEPMALHALTLVIEPPLRDQAQKHNVTLASPEKSSTACSKPLSPTEQAAEDYTSTSDPGSGEGRAAIPPSPVLTGRKGPPEELAGPSGSTSSPSEPAGLMTTCRHLATPELFGANQEKPEPDVVEGPQKPETEFGSGDKLGMKIAQENTDEIHNEQVSRQSETVMIGISPEVDKTSGTNAQASVRAKENEGDDDCGYQSGTPDQELQAMQAVGPDRDCTADRKAKDITVEEPNEQKYVAHEEHGHKTVIDLKAVAPDQLTRCNSPNAKVKIGDVSAQAEQKRVNDADESNEQSKKLVEMREEHAKCTSGNKDPATATEDPEKPTYEGRVFEALKLQVSDAKSGLETTDAKKEATSTLEHKEGSTHEGELSTSPSSGAHYTPSSSDASTPPGSEAHSSPTESDVPDIGDDTKTPAKVSQAEESPLTTRKSGPSRGGKKTYAALAKEPVSGSGSSGSTQTEAKSDPWAVPQGEQTWGRGKK